MQPPSAYGLPFSSWRRGQQLALRVATSARTRHIVINAPTGSGKSIIAGMLPKLRPRRRHVTLTATNALLDQYGNDIQYMTDLRGASHYPCHAANRELKAWFAPSMRKFIKCDDGPCHVGALCDLKQNGCDYFDARRDFIASQAGITNYAAWLWNRRLGQGLGQADVLVNDEAHALPDQLMQASQIDIPYTLLDSHKKIPRGYLGWRRWAEERLEHLSGQETPQDGTRREHLVRSLKLMAFMDESWAWDKTGTGYHFEPTIPRLLMPNLQSFDNGEQCVYLSATITPAMFDLLDVDPNDITFHSVPSTFPVENRPIYFVSGAYADWRRMKDPWMQQRFVDAIDTHCESRPDVRGIVHSVSFDRASFIYYGCQSQSRMLLHEKGVSAQKIVDQFLKSAPGTILVSPSVMTGFDFGGDRARFQIVPKLPFTNTRSNIMKARIRSTPRYQDHYSMQLFMQLCGRINRGESDWGETIVTDENVRWWYKENRDLAAEWFDAAVVETRRVIQPMRRT